MGTNLNIPVRNQIIPWCNELDLRFFDLQPLFDRALHLKSKINCRGNGLYEYLQICSESHRDFEYIFEMIMENTINCV
jgi:hypothetical protein